MSYLLTRGAAVSLIAIPLGFASCLSTIWLTKRYQNQLLYDSVENDVNENENKGDETSSHKKGKENKNYNKSLINYLKFEKNLTLNSLQKIPYLWKTFEGIFLILITAQELLFEFLTKKQYQRFYEILQDLQNKQFKRNSYSVATHTATGRSSSIPKILILESLPKNGVTTLMRSLINSSQVRSCPELDDCLLELRKNINEFPISLRNAINLFCDYYRYSLAEELSLKESCFVVLDRYYHSTCVQQLVAPSLTSATSATSFDTNGMTIDDIPSHAYQWPLDLPVPLLVIYLAVPPEERMTRCQKEGFSSETERSQRLHLDHFLQGLYSLIEGPPIIAMDASGDPATVLETLFQCLESQSLYLRSYHSSSLPLEDSITLIDCFEERSGRRYSMRDISLEEEDTEQASQGELDDVEKRRFPFRRRESQRRGRESQSFEENHERNRESLGVYGAIMQVNWEGDS